MLMFVLYDYKLNAALAKTVLSTSLRKKVFFFFPYEKSLGHMFQK